MESELTLPPRIITGPGASANLPSLAAGFGGRALLVHGAGAPKRRGAVAALFVELRQCGMVAARFAVAGEPDLAMVEDAVALARADRCDMVIGIGGGSVLDIAKAVGGLATNPGAVRDYLEVVGAGKPLVTPGLPIIAVPTTAGTGSEVTRNAVIAVPDAGVKVSLRSVWLIPRLAIVDSALTYGLPPAVTASSGLDALTQLIEAYVSQRASSLTDGFCLQGLELAAGALRQVYHDPEDAGARDSMSAASLLSGMALSGAGLGCVHGAAGVMGGRFPVAHGAACAALLPTVTAANVRALVSRSPTGAALARYRRVASTLAGGGPVPVEQLASTLRVWVSELKIPRLSSCGVSPADIPSIAAQALRANSSRTNPIGLSPGELEEAIAAAL